jgi:ABC-type transport system involved in multi-copper enzyme maturation permease subunit
MTFLTLLTKEMRLSTRRERTIWIIVCYILILGLLGWITISSYSTRVDSWSSVGTVLYPLLLIVQLLLILFITPAFTSTSINGEKERQTFDLLLCSNLSSATLITGKLMAGLINILLLIAASIPLFSLIFFFGGVAPSQVLTALAVFLATAIFTATLGIFNSTIWQRPATSTALSYTLVLIWLGLPLLISVIAPQLVNTPLVQPGANLPASPPPPYFLMWNPLEALLSTFGPGILSGQGNYQFGPLSLTIWQTYIVLDLCVAGLLLVLSIWLVKPHPWARLQKYFQKKQIILEETETTIPVQA